MKLSSRLNYICDIVDKCNTVADIGCDHGKVVAKLFLDNKVSYAYLSDISAKSVQKADDLLKEIGVSCENYKVIVTDGLTDFDTKHIDTVIIAGMGGLEIKKILENNNVDVDTFILGPNNNDVVLRKYLLCNNYKIVIDKVVKDSNKFYNIIKVTKGNSKISKVNLYFGISNFEDVTDDFREYLNYQRTKVETLVNNRLPLVKKIKCYRYLRFINKLIKNISRGL